MTPIETFGNIDIYLFDQILKGRFCAGQRILDAGCGGGRNVVWFLREGFDVHGIDQSDDAVAHCRGLASMLNPSLPASNFRVADAVSLPFDDATFDYVISSAVLHFASSEEHFDRMLGELWRVLKPGGTLFARLASDIGIENLVEPLGDRRFLLPDGSERFLVDLRMLLSRTEALGGMLAEPVKTTNVQNLRAMTTWIALKQ